MKTYKIGAMVTHSGKHLETEVAAYNLWDAIAMFYAYLSTQGLNMEALCELDVSEIVQ
jgi:hypothetical protein